jgi:putative ATPase
LSRTRVLVLEPLTTEEIVTILKLALKKLGKSKLASKAVLTYVAELSAGDARVALGNLELCLDLANDKITIETVKMASQRKLPGYDKGGEQHYNIISAFIKSMRGSDSNAALYYLARMLDAGEDPKFIARRMVIFASEDIGIASSPALNLAVSTFSAVERIGMPECQYNLFHCALVLSASKKSRVVADAMSKAIQIAKSTPNAQVPNHLKNAPTKLLKDLGYGKDYKWKADFKHKKGFLPTELSDLDLFTE